MYLLAGLAGSGASLLTSDAVTVGASGAIFGLLGDRRTRPRGRPVSLPRLRGLVTVAHAAHGCRPTWQQ